MHFFFKLLVLLLLQFIKMNFAESYTCPVQEPLSVRSSDAEYGKKPYVEGGERVFFKGKVQEWGGNSDEVTSPIIDESTGKRTVIGRMARMSAKDAEDAVATSVDAWNSGQGEWPRMSAQARVEALERVIADLRARRVELARTLMWEICKSESDAQSEIDRTLVFMEETIVAYRRMDTQTAGVWGKVQGFFNKVRRAAIGIMLCVGPYNYPFNETYATLIPGLLMGNVAIMKLPAVGGLAHVLTMELYAKHLPKGVLQFVSGSGRETIPAMMRTGKIDVLAFIGGSRTADTIIKEHPHPHRLKVFLQLEGKNLGIVTPSVDVDAAVKEVTTGATNFNGQRCTAIKLVLVHESKAQEFAEKLSASISALPAGLPWEKGVKITPLPEPKKPAYLEGLIADAVGKGAAVINANAGGGVIRGGLMIPAVVYPVTSDMRLWEEEQFGPVVPIATYRSTQDVVDYLHDSVYGQQASVFAKDMTDAAPLVDALANVVGRVNINTQCSRSPDTIPFSGRRSSALGTMSLTEALNVFSVETVVAGKENLFLAPMTEALDRLATFLRPLK